MKKVLVVLVAGLVATVFMAARAHADEKSCCGDMKPGMQEKMMGMHEKMMGRMQGKEGQEPGLDEMIVHKAGFILENAQEMGLSDDQVMKVKTLKMNVEKTKIKNDAELKLLVLDIKAALEKDEIDKNGLNSLIDKKYAIKAQEAKDFVGAYADLKKMITKDQMNKLKDIHSKEMMEEKEEHEHAMEMHK